MACKAEYGPRSTYFHKSKGNGYYASSYIFRQAGWGPLHVIEERRIYPSKQLIHNAELS